MNKLSYYLSGAAMLLAVSVVPSVSSDIKHPGNKYLASASSVSHAPIWSKRVRVPYRSWIPVEKPHVVLLCVHGLGFSSASFSQFGRAMAGRGFAVYALDVRGFGQWMERQNDKVDFEACMS